MKKIKELLSVALAVVVVLVVAAVEVVRGWVIQKT